MHPKDKAHVSGPRDRSSAASWCGNMGTCWLGKYRVDLRFCASSSSRESDAMNRVGSTEDDDNGPREEGEEGKKKKKKKKKKKRIHLVRCTER